MRILTITFFVIFFSFSCLAILARSGFFNLSVADLAKEYETPESKYFDISGLRIHYQDEGSGPALILVHGSFMNLRAWDPVVEKLSKSYRLIRFDWPGIGLSSGTGNEDATDLTIHDIAFKLLTSLGVSKVSCVGTSSGGTVCSNLIFSYPKLVDNFVISNAPSEVVKIPRSERPIPVQIQMLLSDDLLKLRTIWFWKTYYSYLWGTQSTPSDRLLEQYYDYNRRITKPMPISLYVSNYDFRVKSALDEDAISNGNFSSSYYNGSEASMRAMKSISIPTLVIWGMVDPVLPPEKLDQLVGKMPNASIKIERLENVGHYPVLEVPEKFSILLDNFLSES